MRPQGVNDSDSPDPTTMRHRRKTMPYRRDAIASPWRLCRIAAFTLSFVLLQSTALV
jgi:hypothetical protein